MATLSVVLTVKGPASTAITFTPTSPWTGSGTSFSAPGPISAGAVVGVFNITPSNWVGAVTLSGPNSGSFSLSGTGTAYTLTTTAALAIGAVDNVTVTAAP